MSQLGPRRSRTTVIAFQLKDLFGNMMPCLRPGLEAIQHLDERRALDISILLFLRGNTYCLAEPFQTYLPEPGHHEREHLSGTTCQQQTIPSGRVTAAVL